MWWNYPFVLILLSQGCTVPGFTLTQNSMISLTRKKTRAETRDDSLSHTTKKYDCKYWLLSKHFNITPLVDSSLVQRSLGASSHWRLSLMMIWTWEWLIKYFAWRMVSFHLDDDENSLGVWWSAGSRLKWWAVDEQPKEQC